MAGESGITGGKVLGHIFACAAVHVFIFAPFGLEAVFHAAGDGLTEMASNTFSPESNLA